MTIRVLVADDQALVRGSFRLLVSTATDLTPVGEAATGIEATSRPDPDPASGAAMRPAAALAEVTEREREVLTLIGLGLSNTEIAERLRVSMSTAKTHVGRLLMKLRARDRAQLVIAAYDAGLVSPETG